MAPLTLFIFSSLLLGIVFQQSFIMPKLTGKHTLPPVVQRQTSSSAESKQVSVGSKTMRRASPQSSPTSSISQSPYQRHSGSSPPNKENTQTQ